MGMARLPAEDPAHRILSCRDPRGWSMLRGRPHAFVVASDGVLSEGCGHWGLGVCLGDGQTEAEGVPSQGGRRDSCSSVCPHTWPDLTPLSDPKDPYRNKTADILSNHGNSRCMYVSFLLVGFPGCLATCSRIYLSSTHRDMTRDGRTKKQPHVARRRATK